MNATELYEKALAGVESRSIRDWASTPKNKDIWVKICQNALDKKKDTVDPVLMTAYMVATAIGL